MTACSVVSDSLCLYGLYPPGLLCAPDFQARILQWVALSYSRASSELGNQTCIASVSCIAGGFLPLQPYHMILVFLCLAYFTHCDNP